MTQHLTPEVCRRLALIDALVKSDRRASTVEMSEITAADRRTVARDLKFLTDTLGAPIEWNHQKQEYEYWGDFHLRNAVQNWLFPQ